MKLINTLVPLDFRGNLRGPLRRLYVGSFVASLGMGLTFSLFVVYLHNVRGFSTGFSTLLLSLSAVIGLAVAPLWGTLTDRVGPLRVLLVAFGADSAALVLWAFALTRTQAIAATILLAFFGGAAWGPIGTLLARLAGPDHRQWAFGLNFMLTNLGIGLGGLVSALIVNLNHPDSFVLLYLVNAAVQLVAGACYATLHREGGPVARHDDVRQSHGWREVAKDRRLVRYVVASMILMLGGYGSVDAGLSLFVVNNLHLTVHSLGVIFFFNTTTIVLGQIWVLRRIEGRSRTRVMGAVAGFWFVFWILVSVTLRLPAPAALAVLCGAMVVFAIGETMFQPVGSAIVNHIAPEHLRGRYNAAATLAWGVAGTFAPALAALYYNADLGNWWPLGTSVTALVGGALMLNLRRSLSADADGRVDDATERVASRRVVTHDET